MKARISKTFTLGQGDAATDAEFVISSEGDIQLLARWNVVDGDSTQEEVVSFDADEHLDFIIESLCRLRAWQDRPKKAE
jgi:hypothetical protein